MASKNNVFTNAKTIAKNPQQRNIYFISIGLAFVMIVVGVMYASKKPAEQTLGSASVVEAPSIKVAPGQSDSPEYNKQVQIANDRATQEALKNNQSFVPTLNNKDGIDSESPIDLIDRQRELDRKKKEEQELLEAQELARKAEEERAAQPTATPVPPPPPPPAPARVVKVNRFGYGDVAIINALMGLSTNKMPEIEIKHQSSNNPSRDSGVSGDGVAANADGKVAGVKDVKPVVFAKAGDIFNAVLQTSVNSDEPSPVLAQIVSGKLKGTRLVGNIQLVGEKVVLQFTTANIPSMPNSLAVSAVAVDPETSRTAMATSVNNHTFMKYGVLLGSSFLSGWSKAIAAKNTETNITAGGGIVISPKGNQSAGDVNRQALGAVGDQLANNIKSNPAWDRPTIKVDKDLAIGILLLQDMALTSK